MKKIAACLALTFIATLACAQTTPVVAPLIAECATTTDGSVVHLRNPTQPPQAAAAYTGTLPSGNYFVQIVWFDTAGGVSLPSPELQIQLASTGELQINVPISGRPSTAIGYLVYIGTTSGGEKLQGQSSGSSTFTQSIPLVTTPTMPPVVLSPTGLTVGTSAGASNNSVCGIIANDAGWPTGTGYGVTITSPNGSTLPGYPMQWQLLGPGGTINLGQGLPMYNGTVNYPIPILARPYNHAPQSISGPLSMTGYPITQVLKLGIGTAVPAWGVDVQVPPGGSVLQGAINAGTGYLLNGTAGSAGQALCSDGTYFDQVCSFIPAGVFFFYQTMQSNGSDQTQRLKLNFSNQFALSDSSSPSRTGVDLAMVGSPGTCTTPTALVTDAYGRVTSCSSTSPAAADYYFTFSGCTMTVTGNSFNCHASYNFASVSPVVPTQPDTNFFVSCQIITNEDWGTSSNVNSQTTTSFSLVQNVDRYNGITATVTPVVWCHLHHN